ncbi:uncharacterized protein LOC117104483 [Anneissia japonica]|uniref:uncharacterized protein LOC117104483 n=1 Tax=Anneissia japonica TaxID=1529436 RepID=UPI00142580E7|nr:uncharacterized protein LOC117104483 [Anneissia japonica]
MDIPNATSNIESGCGEGIAVKIYKRKRGPSDSDDQPYRKYALDLLNDLDEHKNCLDFDDIPEFYEKFENLIIYYERYGLKLTKVGKGSVVFYLIANNPNALMNLWEVHSSGKLIKDLAGILVPEKHQQEFLDEWMTCIDETEYKAALSNLKAKEKHDELPKLEESKPTLEEMKVPSYEIPVIEIQPPVEISATEKFVQPEFRFQLSSSELSFAELVNESY